MTTITKLRERMVDLGWRDDAFDTDEGFLFAMRYHQENAYGFLNNDKLINQDDVEQSIGFLIDLTIVLKDIDN